MGYILGWKKVIDAFEISRKNVANGELNINMQTTEVKKKYVYIISLKKNPQNKSKSVKNYTQNKARKQKKLPLFFVLKNTLHIS